MAAAPKSTYTVVSCHFGDLDWITHTVKQIDKYSDHRIERIILVDQSRVSESKLKQLPRVSDVISFPPDMSMVEILGHDHPSSLNRALREVEFNTSHVIVLDSDSFPIDSSWLDCLTPVTVASDPHYGSLTHPCLISIPVGAVLEVDFTEGIREIGIDTGRLVGLQLAKIGLRVDFSHPTPAFRGHRGHFYLNGTFYHHGSGSFVYSDDERISRQVTWGREKFFREQVMQGKFDFTKRKWISTRIKGIYRTLMVALKGYH